MAIPETTLIAQAQNGDTSAFETLYQHTVKDLTAAIKAKLRRLGTHAHTADDIVQETYLRALRALPGYEDRGKPFIAWLHTIAGFLILDLLKSAKNRELTFTHVSSGANSASDGWFDRPDRQQDRPEDRTVLADDFTRLMALFPSLTELQQEILLNRYYYGLTVEETAREMGMNPGAVKTRCSAGAASLRRLHADQYPPEPVRIT